MSNENIRGMEMYLNAKIGDLFYMVSILRGKQVRDSYPVTKITYRYNRIGEKIRILHCGLVKFDCLSGEILDTLDTFYMLPVKYMKNNLDIL